jgi:putative Mg2+ transporter-C (MgtC) family protein
MDFLLEAFSFDLKRVVIDLLRVLIAFILAVPIGWERYQSERSLGLRTFPIVAIGSCSFILIAKQIPGADAEAQARVIQGLISGIGFIGGGAILKEGGNVRGLATAASIWCTGAIGAAVAFEREEIAIVISLITFAIMRLLTPIAESGGDDGETGKDKASGGGDENDAESTSSDKN